MSTTLQISLDKRREAQFLKVLATKPDLAGLGFTEAGTKLFFDLLDTIAPMEG